MREFVFGTSAQFDALNHELSCGKKYKFANRQLPDSCSPNTACIWFAKIDGMYHVYIDKDITTSADSKSFKQFLEEGEIKFTCMEEHGCFPAFVEVFVCAAQ